MGPILLTNDDGLDSPALGPLASALQALAPLRVVVPDRERSWVSKAISRWDPIKTSRTQRAGVEITTVSGLPADCVNLGIHSLFEDRPSLVVSGVNIGLNAGLGFFLSSGTVGAAIEGRLSGIPSLAFSVGIPGRDRDWKSRASESELADLWPRAAELVVDIVRGVQERGLPAGVDLLNVNFPLEAGVRTRRLITRVAPVSYAGVFRPTDGGGFVHDSIGGFQIDGDLQGTDIEALQNGRVSITPIALVGMAEVDDGFWDPLLAGSS